jgi:uncharacterized protein (TIGR02453 family)
MPFEGFPDETFRYLAELTANNEKPWFEANRTRYEAHYLTPALAFIETIGPRMQSELAGAVKYEARVNGSLFRINRDVRFSKDKTPYKNHIDMWFWQGERKGWESPGYYMRLLPDEMILGAGMHAFSKEGLETFRKAVVAGGSGEALEQTVSKINEAGPYEIGGESRKTVPRGFDADHPRSRFLLFEGLHASLEGRIPAEAARPGFVDHCMTHFKAMSPINEWLATVIRVD